MLKFNRHGAQLWLSKTRLAIELGVCRRTAQRRVQRLVEMKVLVQIGAPNSYFQGDPNKFRPSTTYEAHPEVLRPRPTWKDFESMRPTHRRLQVKSASQHLRRRPAQPRLVSTPPATPVQPPAKPVEAATTTPAAVPLGSRQFERIRKARAELRAKIAELMQGCRGSIQTKDGGSIWVDEDSSLYRQPMSAEKAFITACMFLQLTEREGRELLQSAELPEGP